MLLNKNITLRPAAPYDWPAIEALLVANKLPLGGARAHLDTYLLAVSNGEVVGSAGAEVYGHIALLRSVAVAPGLHKQGIGKQPLGGRRGARALGCRRTPASMPIRAPLPASTDNAIPPTPCRALVDRRAVGRAAPKGAQFETRSPRKASEIPRHHNNA